MDENRKTFPDEELEEGVEYEYRAPSSRKQVVDTGWAWIILLSTFGMLVLEGASVGIVGMVHVYLLEAFGQDETTTSWAGSLFYGMQFAIAPFASWLNSRWSCRTCMFLGGLMSAGGLAISSQATALWVSFLTYGIISAIGFGLTLPGMMSVLGFWFDKHRGLASGLCVSGTPFGISLAPFLITYLEEIFGWRGALLIFSGLFLNICVFASLQRPANEEKKLLLLRGSCFSQCSGKGIGICSNNLFRKWRYTWLLLAFMFSNFALNTTYIHMPPYVLSLGGSVHDITTILLIMGIGNVGAKILTGLAANSFNSKTGIDKRCLLIGAYSTAATALVILPSVAHSRIGRIICYAFVGCYFNVECPLYLLLLLEIVGFKDLNTAVGFQLFAVGFGLITGPPFTAMVKEITQDYKYCFYTAGVAFGLACICAMVSVIGPKNEVKRENEDDLAQKSENEDILQEHENRTKV